MAYTTEDGAAPFELHETLKKTEVKRCEKRPKLEPAI